jgi:hypothetical protein
MDEQTKRKIVSRYVAAEPRVRAACQAIANRYGLRWDDRLDLEQELWLALVAEWCRRDNASGNESGEVDADALLPNEMDWLWGRWLGGSSSNDGGTCKDCPPLLASALPCPCLVSQNDTAIDVIRRIDLRLDVAALVDRLPPDDRCCCQRLIHDLSAAVHTSSAEPSPLETSRLDALRLAFEAHGFRDYL